MELAKEKQVRLLQRLFCPKEFFEHLYFASMYSALNELLEYIHFCVSTTLLHTLLLLVSIIDESLEVVFEECKWENESKISL